MKYYLIFFVSIILVSCQDEITLDLPQSENKLVVQASIEQGYPPYIILTKNQGYFESIDINTYNDLFITNVDSMNIWYYENDIKISKNLKLIPVELSEEFFSAPFPIYTIADSSELINILTNPGNYNFSEAGRTYYLEIGWNNQIITAETTIPIPTPLDCLWVEQNETADKDFKCDIRAIYSDPVEIQNNILIKSKRIQHYEKKDSLECNVENNPDFPLNIIDCGPDVLINGESFETYFPRPKEEGFPTGAYNSYHTKECNDGSILEFNEDVVLIKFCQIDEPSMKFWRGLVRQVGTNGNPFAEPMNLVSNIDGGLGIFTGYGAVYYKVPIIKGRTITETYNDSLFITDIF